MRTILQSKVSEYTLAGLVIVGNRHGLHVVLTGLRSKFPACLKSVMQLQLVAYATVISMTVRCSKIEVNKLSQVLLLLVNEGLT